MLQISSELLFYGGIAIMAAAAVLAVISIIVLSLTGRSLKKRLEEEYGKPRQ